MKGGARKKEGGEQNIAKIMSHGQDVLPSSDRGRFLEGNDSWALQRKESSKQKVAKLSGVDNVGKRSVAVLPPPT